MKASVPWLVGVCLLAGAAEAGKPRKPNAREQAEVKQALAGAGEPVLKKTVQVVLKGAGSVLFVPVLDFTAQPPLRLLLLQDGKVLHTLAASEADKAWPILQFQDVAFKDVNGDGFEDVLTLARYMPGVGPKAGKPFHQAAVYLSRGGKSFEPVAKEVSGGLNQPPPAKLAEVLKRLKKISKTRLSLPRPAPAAPTHVSASPAP
ncbi:hypothetical protein [Stigmatella erecta]|uniref:Repeat domain-containing protein n=1 Tax=Stigmatella erecta TaxID=83460 RepID=A0A1I0KGJ3_9BACT|nr:hypothetical protein [Stigmatella erecta]SEU23493.1 hypothetical protein SAMN05443639_110259 [Stigmatella erecta]